MKSEKKWSGREKMLCLALGIVSVITIVMILGVFVIIVRMKISNFATLTLKGRPVDSANSVCLTEECTKAAGDMIKALDKSVAPCENFYQFACGTWMKNNPVPDSGGSWSQFSILRDQLSRKIRGILDKPIDENEPEPAKIAKTFYRSCIDDDNADDHTMLEGLTEKFIKGIKNEFSQFGQVLGEMRREVGGNFLFSVFVDLDEGNTSSYTVYLDQPILGLNQIYLTGATDSNYSTAYTEFVQSVWPVVYPASYEDPIKVGEEVIAFERRLAEISSKPDERRNRTELYSILTIDELQAITGVAPMLNWEVYFTELFSELSSKQKKYLGDFKNFKIVVRDSKFLKKIGILISETIRSSPHVIRNYLKWRLILSYGNEVSKGFRDLFLAYLKKTQGTQFATPRWHTCTDHANAVFGMAISYHYIRETFSDDSKEKMNEMVKNIRDAFYDIIHGIKWIASKKTRDKAIEKAAKMIPYIGYPEGLKDSWRGEETLRLYYKGMNISMTQNHFKNYLQLVKWKITDSFANIGTTKDPKRWIADPTVVNAFYSSTHNSIIFPAGILQPPFYFTGNAIQALNYGAIGSVIGHEITHGFDDKGRQSDGDGNLINWWDSETLKNYLDRTRCFVQQYGGFEATELQDKYGTVVLNGNNTLGENIADNGGLREAYRAYQSYVRKNGEEKHLPGLEYTPEQLFFISFAQIWCGSYTKQNLYSHIQTGVHSPNRFRVNGALANSPEFARAWHCKRPKPENICRIW